MAGRTPNSERYSIVLAFKLSSDRIEALYYGSYISILVQGKAELRAEFDLVVNIDLRFHDIKMIHQLEVELRRMREGRVSK
jgi:hypothetical protein